MKLSLVRATRAVALLCCAVAVLVVPSAFAGASTATASAGGSLWFVELSGAPAADGGSLDALKAEKAAFKALAAKEKLAYKERLSFNTLWNGISIAASPETAASLGKLDGVKNIWPVLEIEVPETASANPELASAIQMTGADIAQNELGLSGDGVRVAVMDTGIDYDNASLGGSGTDADPNSDDTALNGFPNNRVVVGWDFVGNTFNASTSSTSYNPVPAPDPDPDDCNGHGTHVAGIVGANGAITGVAPGVVFGAYRVFGCGGSTTADIMLAAMERALADDMDILNMSIGSAFMTWPQYPTAAGADRLVNKGMVVVASIGNSGADGVYSAGAPGVGRKVIGVGSLDNSKLLVRSFTISPDNTSIGYLAGGGSAPIPTSGTFPLARTGTKDSAADACTALPAGSLSDKIALIRRGGCDFVVKQANARNAGAIAVVLYNNQNTGLLTPAAIPDIPVVFIDRPSGELINDRLALGPVDLTWTANLVQTANPTAGLASSFTSYGLTAELDVKPDVAAPGGFIRSTYPLERGGAATLSGTSMASPHTAGAVALMLEAHPSLSVAEIREALQNTADPAVWSGNPGLGFFEPVHRQGAGMIDIDDAIQTTTSISPSKLALGESEAGAQTRALTIRNTSSSPVTYALSNVSAIGTRNTFPALGFLLQSQSVSFSQAGVPVASVTVPAAGSATVDVTITPPVGASQDKTVYGGYVTFTVGTTKYRVPYAGFVGDYQSLRILDSGAAGIFPAIGRLTGPVSATDRTPVHTPVAAGATFTMTGGDIPYVLAHFAHQARQIRVELFETATSKRVGEVLRDEYRERNSRRTGTTTDANTDVYLSFAIDGTVKKGNGRVAVSDGSYYAVFSVLKALGDSANPAHTESWTSAAFTIDRP
ncbi:MAG: peptidase [Desertimonas sp.]|nr:peptidase [Desertimonas sp.]